ncbi:MFS transporter [Nocardia wallacei]|uniref:MFS transporter n=1 Tax=Nocardia wallacei TaxID=480035 RepID=UPI002455D60E|nr:MFS transporter [Nocardia wallacei]
MTGYDARARLPAVAVVGLCTLIVIAEGYDLIMYGAMLPALLDEPGWGMTKSTGGTVGSMVYVGMTAGALAGGRLADRFGRRRPLLVAVAWFAAWTAACALAGSPWQLGAFRLLAGIGMGAAAAVALALAKEYTPPGRTGLTVTTLMAGIPLGGIISALAGLALLSDHGWRPLCWIGAIASGLVLLAALALLPESEEFARTGTASRVRELFTPDRRLLTLLFAVAAFAELLTWYGLNTWMTTLMRELDYPMTSALQFSMTLNTGAVVGSFALAIAADRWGARPVAGVSALVAAAGIACCAAGLSGRVALLAVIAVLGAAAHSTLNLINAAVADTYPARLRGSALGWSNGVGRLGAVAAPSLGGWVLSATGPLQVFQTFILTSVCAAVVLAVLARSGRRAAALRPARTPVAG